MSQGIRARLTKLERAPKFQQTSSSVGLLIAVLGATLHEILLGSENTADRQAAAELLQYGSESTATFTVLSDQSLRLSIRLLEGALSSAGVQCHNTVVAF